MTTPCRTLIFFAALTVWLLPLFTLNAASVEADWVARVWQSDDGLPDNNVTGVAQTTDGYLWITTQGGLARFDGAQFKRVSLPVLSGMPIEMIRAMTIVNGDHLWLALEGGVVVSAAPHETKVYTAADKLPVVRPTSITQDGKGAVWVGYADGSIFCVEGNEAEHVKGKQWPVGTGWCWLTSDTKGRVWFAKPGHVGMLENGQFVSVSSMPEHSVCLAAARDGGIWICAGSRLLKYNGHETVKLADLSPATETTEPLVVYEDREGAVWIGTTADGLFRFDGKTVARVETARGEIRCVTEDAEGNIWVGMSGGGLTRLRPRALRLFGTESGLPFGTVRSVCEDSSGLLWVVTQNGVLARGRGGHWSVTGTNAGEPGGKASCVASDAAGFVSIGTTTSGLHQWRGGKFSSFHKSDGLASERVWAVMSDSATNLWIALGVPNCVQRFGDGKFETFELPPSSLVVRAMAEDASHTIWFGTEDGRLLRVDGAKLEDETHRTLGRSVPIRCLQATRDGSLWIGYAGAGLGRLKNGRFAKIGVEQGIPDDFISQIEPDDHDALWFAGNRGIFQMQQSELDDVAEGRTDRARAILFGKNEGVPSLQANFGFGLASVRTRAGEICFSMLTGLAVVTPEKIRTNGVPPRVAIERASIDGIKLPIPGASQLLGDELNIVQPPQSQTSLEVPPEHHELKIEFSALSFAAPENVRLRYRMEGYDSHWNETAQRSVTYPQMPAGNYQFRVIACNNSGVWNETGAILPFLVRPFFWQTWWFQLTMIAGAMAGFITMGWYVSSRRMRRELVRLEQESALQKDRARIAKDLHDDLGANLSQIAMLSELAQTDLHKPAEALGHLDQIFQTARLITRSLDEIVWAVNPRNDTLDRFVAHLCQFSPEFLRAAGIRCRLDMPMEVPAVTLAANVRHQLYLGVKEALHNIVKHSGATEVWLRLAIDADKLTLVVEDNGRGFEKVAASKSGEDGLTNLRHRMEEIDGHFEHHSEAARGTRLTFVAPLKGKTT